MKNTMKKLAFVMTLMAGSSLIAQPPVELNMQALQQIDNCDVANQAAAFLQDIANTIHELLATRSDDAHYNTKTFKAIVEWFTKRLALFDASGLEQQVKDLVAQGTLNSDEQEALKGFLDLIKDRKKVCEILKKQTQGRPSPSQLLMDLKDFIQWLPEIYRLPVKQNDGPKKQELEKRLGERMRMK